MEETKTKKKSSTIIWIILLLILGVVFLCGLLGFFGFKYIAIDSVEEIVEYEGSGIESLY